MRKTAALKSVLAPEGVSIHHRMLNASFPCSEHIGESYNCGESKSTISLKDCAENACFSCRSSPSSTVTSSEASVSAAWKQVKISPPKEEILTTERDEDMDTSWTDDKHSSYLSCMEEMFVRNMYDREYCAVDICGESSAASSEQDCVESKLPSTFFKVMQGGGWQPLPCRRLHSWEVPSPSISLSPWIQHFRAKKKTVSAGGGLEAAKQTIICKTSTAYELEDDAAADDIDLAGDDNQVPEVPDVETIRSSAWLERHNSTGSSNAVRSRRRILRHDRVHHHHTGLPQDHGKIEQCQLPQRSHETSSSSRRPESIDQVVPLGKRCKRS